MITIDPAPEEGADTGTDFRAREGRATTELVLREVPVHRLWRLPEGGSVRATLGLVGGGAPPAGGTESLGNPEVAGEDALQDEVRNAQCLEHVGGQGMVRGGATERG